MTISMDPGWDEAALRDPRLLAMIADLDLFMPNQSELCHIAGDADVARAAARVLGMMRGGTSVVKQGAAGATAFAAHQAPVHAPATPVTPVDTTGAGDAFDAGFLSQYIQGSDLAGSMRFGAVCGALSTTAPGGIGALPTVTEVESWLAKLRS